MNQSSIQSLSIDDLQRYTNAQQGTRHKGILVSCYGGAEHPRIHLFKSPIRINAITFTLIMRGEGRIIVDQREVKVGNNTLLVVPPNSIVSSAGSDIPTQGMVVMLDPQYLSECNLNVKKITQHMMAIVRNGLAITLTETEAKQLVQAIEMITAQIGIPHQSIFGEDVIRSAVELVSYLCLELFSRHQRQATEAAKMTSTRAEEYFNRFLVDLSQHYLERRPVTYYAERLCISSRYLTTIVRQVSGHSVTQWMSRYLLAEAKYLLKYSELSVQEIAYRLSFPNQSFFGKYFKQHAGVAPSAYRVQS